MKYVEDKGFWLAKNSVSYELYIEGKFDALDKHLKQLELTRAKLEGRL